MAQVSDAASEREGGSADGDDSVLPFQLDRLDVRGRVARLDRTLDRILSQHDYPPKVSALLGEAALLSAMIGQAMKLRHRFSIQVQTDGPVNLIATDIFAAEDAAEPADMRAYARFDRAAVAALPDAAGPADLLGAGHFAMTIDQGPHMSPYQGVTPLLPEGFAASAEAYFAQSDQIATRFATAVGQAFEPGGAAPRWRAGGVMIQHLAPFGEKVLGSPEAAKKAIAGVDPEEAIDDWRRATVLLDTVEQIELVGPHVTPERLLVRLFHEEEPRVYPAQKIRFGCTCGPERVVALLSQYDRPTLEEMTTEDGDVTAECQFCGRTYRFELDDLAPAENGAH